ncbi:hypothetical protein NESM_000432100 [Novymonas esmeraldas]|uniref:Uncharacterized protein n=1 Tax=Novymonas esmeraldas TaxID=1808958 RepID=A0AAW0EPL5_9TRYP
MSELPRFRSGSAFQRDEEGSQSLSQVRARPAIRLDTSLSFLSTTSIIGGAGSFSGPASPLLPGPHAGSGADDGRGRTAGVASPTLFRTRDINFDSSNSHHHHRMIKESHSRTVSSSRHTHSATRYASPSSHSAVQVFSQGRRHAAAATDDDRSDALDALVSEATVMTRPSEPLHHGGEGVDDEAELHSQRVSSATVSPAPRHAMTLSTELDDVFDISHNGAPGNVERAGAGAGVAAGARANDDDDVDDATRRGEDEVRLSSISPPPRRAFVLSRRYSGAGEETDGSTAVPTPSVAVSADAPRSSAVLVMDGDDDDDDTREGGGKATGGDGALWTAAAAAAAAALARVRRVTSPTLAVGRLRPGVVIEEADAGAVRATAAATGRAIAAERVSASSSMDSCSIMSPLPRPVASRTHSAAAESRRSSPAHARDDDSREEDDNADEEQPSPRGGADETVPERSCAAPTAAVAAAAAASAAAAAAAATEAAASAAPDLACFSMHSEALPAHRAASPAADGVADSAALQRSVSGASSATAAALARVSSLWLVSGATPTPLRRLRDRDRDASASLDGEEDLETNAVAEAPGCPPHRACPNAAARSGLSRALSAGDAEATGEVDVGDRRETSSPPRSTRPPPSPTTHRPASASAPSLSPEPARPQVEMLAPPSPPPSAAATAAVVDAVATDATLREAASAAGARPTPACDDARSHVPAPSAAAADRVVAASVEALSASSSSASAECARLSAELKELVERAQAEVRRTRDSLLSTLRSHRADFRLSESSPTPRDTPAAPGSPPPFTCASPNLSVTPTRSLHLPPAVDTAATPTAAAAAPVTRTSGEWRSAAATLRPQLRAAADAVLRRLQGYDARDHGVLPMETVVRVLFFITRRRQMPVATWSLRTPAGAVAATPMRASMVASRPGAEVRVAAPARTPGSVAETPRQQRLALHCGDDTAMRAEHDGVLFPGSNAGSWTRPRRPSAAGEADARSTGTEGGRPPQHREVPVTCMSPSRTLEHVMALQQRRAEEELYLQFYFTVLEVFRQVFGERYAWRHLGATNASRHDCAIHHPTQPGQKRRRPSDTVVSAHVDSRAVLRERAAAAAAAAAAASATAAAAEEEEDGAEQEPLVLKANELNDVAAPLETLFPRLRQQYAFTQRERGDTAASPIASAESARSDAAAAAMGLAHRPPPLDVLVYYRVLVDSLREL